MIFICLLIVLREPSSSTLVLYPNLLVHLPKAYLFMFLATTILYYDSFLNLTMYCVLFNNLVFYINLSLLTVTTCILCYVLI